MSNRTLFLLPLLAMKWLCVVVIWFLVYLWYALRVLVTPKQKYSKIPIFFIISCGRSGSSILGKMLGKHRDLCYTSEGMLWTRRTCRMISPMSDMHIIPDVAFVHLGRLVYTASDASCLKIRVMRYRFYQKMNEENKGITLHKFPRHIFRLPFIHKIFPEARFIFLYRNGLDVAASIARQTSGSKVGVWHNNLAACECISDAKLKEAAGDSPFLRSLLYWRMNMGYGVKFFKELPKDKYMQVCYKDLCEHPEDTVKSILSFMDLDYDPAVIDFAREKIKPKHVSAGEKSLSEEEQLIGGKYLPASMSSPLKLGKL